MNLFKSAVVFFVVYLVVSTIQHWVVAAEFSAEWKATLVIAAVATGLFAFLLHVISR